MWGVFYDQNNEALNEGLIVLHANDPKVGGLHLVKGFYAEEEAAWGRFDDLLADWSMGLYSYC